jgi:hypothetical protein
VTSPKAKSHRFIIGHERLLHSMIKLILTSPVFYPTMAILAQHRVGAWNIVIKDKGGVTRTGAYQPSTKPFLTWRDFFNDLLLCFDLEEISASGQLSLWFQNSDGAGINEINAPCIYSQYSDSPQSDILDRLIKVPSDPKTRLILSLVAHDRSSCTASEFDMETHVKKGIIDHNNSY